MDPAVFKLLDIRIRRREMAGRVEYKEYICVQMDYEKREAFLDGLRLTQCALESTTYFTLRVEIRFQLILLSRNGI